MRVKYRNVYIVLVLIALLGLTGCSYDDVLELFDFSGSKGESTITIEKDSGNADCADMPIIVMHTDDDMKISIEPVIEEETALPWQEEVWDDVNKIYSKSAASPTEITLGFAGDICFYDEYANMSTLRSQANGIYDCILEGVMNGLKAVDIMMVNNEFAYSDRGTPTAGKKYAFRSKPSNVSMLDDMGVDIVSLANNHAYDWGPDALMDTFDILTEAKVPYVGAGRNIDEAVKPALLEFYNEVQATNAREAGNGRLVRNKIEEAILNQSKRLVAEADADMSLLTEKDFEFNFVG